VPKKSYSGNINRTETYREKIWSVCGELMSVQCRCPPVLRKLTPSSVKTIPRNLVAACKMACVRTELINIHARFDVLRAILLDITVFWNVTLCRSVSSSRRFGELCTFIYFVTNIKNKIK
jgi:hypothetical protein